MAYCIEFSTFNLLDVRAIIKAATVMLCTLLSFHSLSTIDNSLWQFNFQKDTKTAFQINIIILEHVSNIFYEINYSMNNKLRAAC